jgi:hypothetical protein
MPTTIEMQLIAHSDRYDDEDPRWLDQVADLTSELRRETEAVRHRREPAPGAKGAADQMILALGTAGAFKLAVDVVRTWLARDKSRSLRITVSGPDGSPRTVELSAENAGGDAWQPIIEAAARLSQERP